MLRSFPFPPKVIVDMAPFEWTDEIAGKAEHLWTRGYSATEIATEIRAPSRSTVLGYMNRNRARFPKKNGEADPNEEPKRKQKKLTPEDLQKASALWKAKYRLESIADAIGYSISGMKGIVKRYRGHFPRRDIRDIREVNEKEATAPLKPLYRHAGKIACEPVAFIDLSSRNCKWILSDLDDHEGPDSLCCGAKRLVGSSYCEEHYKMSRGPGTSIERRAHQMPSLRKYR